jgi:transcriptional regulator with XRE-family HTH domain
MPGTIGEILKKAREDKNLSLEDVETATKIKREYLKALEQENFEKIPAPVYVRGYLRQYARYLGLNDDELVQKYNDVAGKSIVSKITQPAVRPVKRPFAFTSGLLAAIAGFLAFALLVGYIAVQIHDFAVYHKPVSKVVHHTNTSKSYTKPPAPTPAPTPPPPAYPLELQIHLIGYTWIEVIADGKIVAEANYQAGTTLSFNADKTIEVITGKAGNTYLTLNGKSLGPMGVDSQVVTRTFTAGSST